MNIALQLLQLVVSFLLMQAGGGEKSAATIGESLSKIVRLAAKAYFAEVGRPIDPSLIKAEKLV